VFPKEVPTQGDPNRRFFKEQGKGILKNKMLTHGWNGLFVFPNVPSFQQRKKNKNSI
jgi:hypothetical protein